MLEFEDAIWRDTPTAIIAGVDEAGRGALAGPVVAAVVAAPYALAHQLYQGELKGMTDSKKLTVLQREKYFERLTKVPDIGWATGLCTPAEIDRINILAATHLAMQRALDKLYYKPDHVLIDGLPVKGIACISTAIVQGDARSFLIAAASVVAKVTRDHLMIAMDQHFPQYGFAAHKGYGVHDHIAALVKYGATTEHRHSFRPVADADQQLLL